MQNNKKIPISKIRKLYILKLIGRCFILICCALLWIFSPQRYEILNGMNFFDEFSILHILWLIWCIDMFLQIVPVKNELALGSQKLFANRFKPIREKISKEKLKKHIVSTTTTAYKVFILWILLIATIGGL